VDGTPIPGATMPSYDVPASTPPGPHDYHFTVTCSSPLPCGGVSATRRLVIEAPRTEVVDYDLPALLELTRAGGYARLEWADDRPEAGGYNVYAGSLDNLWRTRTYDHWRERCAVVRRPDGASTSRTTVPLLGVNTYYLVSAGGCLGEGGLGASSLGTRRPVPGFGPACGALPSATWRPANARTTWRLGAETAGRLDRVMLDGAALATSASPDDQPGGPA
jgi:hypothetical protein